MSTQLARLMEPIRTWTKWLQSWSPSLPTFLLIWSLVVAVSLTIWFIIQGVANGWNHDFTLPTTGSNDVQPPATQVSRTPEQTPVAAPQSSPHSSPQDETILKTRWIEFKARVEDISAQVEAAALDVEAWSALLKELPVNEAGSRIAGSDSHVAQFCALRDAARPAARNFERLRETLQVYLETPQKYLGEPDVLTAPNAALTGELERLQREAEKLAQDYRRDRQALETLLAETAGLPRADLTLEKAIEQRAKDVANAYLAQLTAARAAAEEEAQRTLREAEQAATRAKADADAERMRKEAEEHVKTQQQQAEIFKREEEAKRLRALAEDQEIQKQFSCFLEDGVLQFTGGPTYPLGKSQRPAPVSFGDLNRYGWLKNVESFAAAMTRSPCPNYGEINDRPTRAYPRRESEWAVMDRLLEQFRTLGPVWVEMGLLQP